MNIICEFFLCLKFERYFKKFLDFNLIIIILKIKSYAIIERKFSCKPKLTYIVRLNC